LNNKELPQDVQLTHAMRRIEKSLASMPPLVNQQNSDRDTVKKRRARTSAARTVENEDIKAAMQVAASRTEDIIALTKHIESVDAARETAERELKSLSNNLSSKTEILNKKTDLLSWLQEEAARNGFKRAVAIEKASKDSRRARFLADLLYTYIERRPKDNEIYDFCVQTGLFCATWYKKDRNVSYLTDLEALDHYVNIGSAMGANPSVNFSSEIYKNTYPDVTAEALDPLWHYVKFGIKERRNISPVDRKYTTKIIMMMKNENDLVLPWVLYHGTLFGFENLTIIDNGSEPEVKRHLELVESYGVSVIYNYNSVTDFLKKGDIVAQIIRDMDDASPADFYFPLDCDEFIGAEDAENGYKFDIHYIEGVLAEYLGSKDSLTISAYLDNHPTLPGRFKKSGPQRKSFFPARTCAGLDRGFNNPRLRTAGGRRQTKIVYVHYHFKPYELLQAHARQKLQAFISDLSEENIKNHIENKGSGFHYARHLLMTERDYLSRINASLYQDVPSFTDFFDLADIKLPFDRRRPHAAGL
jgi:hypothetical protein